MAHHHSVFFWLSLLVAVFGSWTALDLFRRVRSHIGRARVVWLGAAATAMGASIWSMHFVAMLGFDPGSPVRYDIPLTILSLALAISATCGAFFTAARDRTGRVTVPLAGLAMGAGICLMHYVGMAALRTAVSLGYDFRLVAVSLLIAVAASTAALYAARRERSLGWRIAAAPILGAAIVGMHYTAMAALRLTPTAEAAPHMGAPPLALGAAVTGGTLIVLFLALLASLYDQRLNVLAALDAGGVGYWEMSLPSRALQMSAKGKEILGLDPDAPLGEPELAAILAPGELERRDRLLSQAVEQGGEHDAEYQLRPSANGARWVNVRGRVVRDPAGRPRRMVGVVLDVTERREAFAAVADSERRQRLLIDELNHRVKNTLATVQSIARQTGKGAASMQEFRDLFEARLLALSNTHNLLTRTAWERASLHELLAQEFHPYSRDRVRIVGPDVELNARQALALGLVIHELTTNAAKYGALSSPAGWVTVRSAVETRGAARTLRLRWREQGGPPVTAPQRRGFGSRLVAGSAAELGGAAKVEFAADGLACELRAPLDDETPPAPFDILQLAGAGRA